jgi:hypothetical protein
MRNEIERPFPNRRGNRYRRGHVNTSKNSTYPEVFVYFCRSSCNGDESRTDTVTTLRATLVHCCCRCRRRRRRRRQYVRKSVRRSSRQHTQLFQAAAAASQMGLARLSLKSPCLAGPTTYIGLAARRRPDIALPS